METKQEKSTWKAKDYQLFSMSGLSLLFLLVFAYIPMIGILLAFKDGDGEANLMRVIIEGDFVNFDNFKEFLLDPEFWDVFQNTLVLNLLLLLFQFPAPIFFALFLNEITRKQYKSVVQTAVTLPHFLSWTIFGGIVLAMTNVNTGIVNPILEAIGLSSAENPVNLARAEYFWPIMIIVSIIKETGWGAIIYLAAIAGIDQELYEAATIDGAGRFTKMFYITLPNIMGTVVLYFILNLSNLLSNSFEQFYIFQNGVNLERSEVLATYIYKMGLGSSIRRFSYASAMGLFESLAGIILLVTGNIVCKKLTGRGIYNGE